MIKRSKYYSVVDGVTVDGEGNVQHAQVIVTGRCRDERNAMRRAKREYDGEFIPTGARQYAQKYAMPDAEFFAAATVLDGEEPTEVGYHETPTTAEAVEDDFVTNE